MPCLHSPCRGSWRGRRSWRETPALPTPLRGGSSLLIIFEKAPPQHVLLVLGYLEDCSSGRGKLQGKMNQRHHIPSLSLNYVDISIPLFQKVPPGSCPRHDGKKETMVGLCNLTNKMDSGGTKPPSRQTYRPPKEALSCRQSAGGSATHIPRGVSLRSPEQHHSHHFTVTHLRGNPQGSCPVLQTK